VAYRAGAGGIIVSDEPAVLAENLPPAFPERSDIEELGRATIDGIVCALGVRTTGMLTCAAWCVEHGRWERLAEADAYAGDAPIIQDDVVVAVLRELAAERDQLRAAMAVRS
jgi:hypothetical protein